MICGIAKGRVVVDEARVLGNGMTAVATLVSPVVVLEIGIGQSGDPVAG